MGRRRRRSVHSVLADFPGGDFSVLEASGGFPLLLCRFCRTVVDWTKRSRVQDHVRTRMHRERKDKAGRHIDGGDRAFSSSVEMGPSAGHLQQYCLRWNNHQGNLLGAFSRLLGSDRFTDVTLATASAAGSGSGSLSGGGSTLRAHRVVLSACSSYFESLLTSVDGGGGGQAGSQVVIILKDVSFADASAIVEFMYRGEISVAQEQLPSLLRAAESLKVKGLAEVSGSTEEEDSANMPTPSPPPVAKSGIKRPPPPPPQVDPATGEVVKRKRGRPRLLDSPGESPDLCFSAAPSSSSRPAAEPVTSSSSLSTANHQHPRLPLPASFQQHQHSEDVFCGDGPTPGGPLTVERLPELGIVKMNSYLTQGNGTRQQYWEETFVKTIMQAVRNKEIDMKTSAELLGVSYGTLYGRYRDTFGYLKGGWNNGGAASSSVSGTAPPTMLPSPYQHKRPLPSRLPPVSLAPPLPSAASAPPPSVVVNNANSDVDQERILRDLGSGAVSMREAATLLGVDETMLAYQLASKLSSSSEEAGNEEEEEEDLPPPEEEESQEEHVQEATPDLSDKGGGDDGGKDVKKEEEKS